MRLFFITVMICFHLTQVQAQECDHYSRHGVKIGFTPSTYYWKFDRTYNDDPSPRDLKLTRTLADETTEQELFRFQDNGAFNTKKGIKIGSLNHNWVIERINSDGPAYQNGHLVFSVNGGASSSENPVLRLSSKEVLANDEYRMMIDDGIVTDKLRITNSFEADYVFQEDYDLRPIDEVERFVKEHKHLPDFPSAEEIRKNGFEIASVNEKFLEKIEELTLYVIDLEKRMKALESENEKLKEKAE